MYETKYQDTLVLSTTEAEFTAACNAGKLILYVCSILEEINIPQDKATSLHIDNNGALMMANAQQPTRQTRYIKKFALLDWVKQDLILMKQIGTSSSNCADTMTKQTGHQLFYRHFDYILGKVIPKYAQVQRTTTSQVSTLDDQAYETYMTNTNAMITVPILSHNLNFQCSFKHGGDIST